MVLLVLPSITAWNLLIRILLSLLLIFCPTTIKSPGVWMIVNSILLLLFYHCTSTNPRHSFSLKVLMQILHSLPETPCSMARWSGQPLWLGWLWSSTLFECFVSFINSLPQWSLPLPRQGSLYSIHHSSDSSPPILTALLFSSSPLLISVVEASFGTIRKTSNLRASRSSRLPKFLKHAPFHQTRSAPGNRDTFHEWSMFILIDSKATRIQIYGVPATQLFSLPSCEDEMFRVTYVHATTIIRPDDYFAMFVAGFTWEMPGIGLVCFERGLYLDFESWYFIFVQAEWLWDLSASSPTSHRFQTTDRSLLRCGQSYQIVW